MLADLIQIISHARSEVYVFLKWMLASHTTISSGTAAFFGLRRGDGGRLGGPGMSLHGHSVHRKESGHTFLSSRAGLVLIGFLIVGGALLFTEHRAHVLGILVWLPLFICPLMHIFMHRDHGPHASQANQKREIP